MIGYDRQRIALAISLACLAGYVNATGFIATGGLFVSFMSGNSTRLGVAAGEGQVAQMGLIFGLICLFVIGVIVGTAVSSIAKARKPAVLGVVTLCLLAGAICQFAGATLLTTGLMVLAMGAENAVFQRDGEVSIGLTYMTGTLVKLGQQLAGMFAGGPKTTWIPYALHWLGLATGAIVGAIAHRHLLAFSLWPAVVGAAGLYQASRKLPSPPR